MKKTFKFEKEESGWFIDLPEYIEMGGTKAELQMIAGADTWLDKLSNNGNHLKLVISDDDSSRLKRQLILSETCTDETGGAIYYAFETEESSPHQLWLCDVTLFVFGEFPKSIYYGYSK